MHRRRLLTRLGALAFALAAAVAAPLVAQAGGGCHAANDFVYTEGSSTFVKTDLCSFVPTVIRVPVGSVIRFLNSDNQDHMVVGRNSTWASGVLSPGQEFQATFTAKGTFPYSCPLHPGMVGAVVVGDGIGLAGGAAVGVPESVLSTGAPPSAAPSVGATTPASAPTASPATSSQQPARADAPVDTTAIAAVLAAVAGVIAGAVGGRVVSRRRPETATR